jgi:transcriptional regulator with XRE-family HTH domain
MSEAPSLFHERLAAERRRLDLKVHEAAAAAGVKRQSYAKYEQGETKPNAESLMALRTHGFDLAYLFTGRRSVAALTEDERDLLAAFNAAPPLLRCAALAVLRCVDD